MVWNALHRSGSDRDLGFRVPDPSETMSCECHCLFPSLSYKNKSASFVLRDIPLMWVMVRGRVTAPSKEAKLADIHHLPVLWRYGTQM